MYRVLFALIESLAGGSFDSQLLQITLDENCIRERGVAVPACSKFFFLDHISASEGPTPRSTVKGNREHDATLRTVNVTVCNPAASAAYRCRDPGPPGDPNS